jgi:hypothetical protein
VVKPTRQGAKRDPHAKRLIRRGLTQRRQEEGISCKDAKVLEAGRERQVLGEE